MKRLAAKRRLVLALSILVPLLGMTDRAAVAATAASGGAAFSGTAELETFPCEPPPPFGNGPCTGDFTGDWAGHLSGVSGTSPFEVTWTTHDEPGDPADPDIEVYDFTYAEWDCNLGVAETVLGIARGTGSATAGPGQIDGNWYVVPNTFPRDIVGLRLDFDFRWTRVGATAVIQLTRATLQLDVTGIGPATVIDSPQAATAMFLPTTTGGGAPSCDNQHEVTGLIAGALNFDSVTP